MKVEHYQSGTFKPVELKITIESLEELCDLYNRLNIHPSVLKERLNSYKGNVTCHVVTASLLFNKLASVLKEYE